MNQNPIINRTESSFPVRVGHLSEVTVDSVFLLGDKMEMPYGYCRCGCGELAPIATRNYPYKGVLKGEPRGFISRHQFRRKAEANPNWKGGRGIDTGGYVSAYAPNHKKASKGHSYVREHILIAERVLGKYLPDNAEVHHVDGVRSNNENSNLVICDDDPYHKCLHTRTRSLLACGDAKWRMCIFCHVYDDISNMTPQSLKKYSYYHKECRSKSRREKRAAKKEWR